jgi:hypothetical protein
VDKADAASRNDFGSIGAVLMQRIGGAFEVGPAHGLPVETQHSGDSTHVMENVLGNALGTASGKRMSVVSMLRRTRRDG